MTDLDNSMNISTDEMMESAPSTSTSECLEVAHQVEQAPLEETPRLLEGLLGLEINKFENLYRLEKRLRSGSFGTVYETQHVLHPDQRYAVKIIDRARLKPKDDKAVFTEVSVLRDLHDVENVVKVIDFFVEPDKLYVVQMLARGGDVFDRLTQRTKYSESDARHLAVTLIKTIEQIHKRSIVHRDLKPENLLLKEALNDTAILVADFGFAKRCKKGEFLKTRCGTPAFVAPEIVVGNPYNASCDMWAIGAILYMLVCGYPPFQGKEHNDLFRKIRASDFTFHDKYWKKVSLAVKQLISGLLTVNANNRLTAEQAMENSWMQKLPSEVLEDTDLTDSLREMKKFKARQKLRGAMGAVRWAATASFWMPGNISFSQHKARSSQVGSAMDGEAAQAVAEIQQDTFRDRYELVTKIRKGSFATVWLCHHKITKEDFAVKIIKRTGLSPEDDEAVMNEVTIMQSLSAYGQYVVQLVDFSEEPDYFFLVMEYMSGGDVFDQIVERTSYTEKDARDLAKVLLKAVKCLHDNGIAHRDIKPQNLLLESKTDAARIKLCDFGFARRVHTPQSITHRVGTPSYVAPEVLKNIPHDTAVDMWGLGVTIYGAYALLISLLGHYHELPNPLFYGKNTVLLVGYAPFMEDDQLKLFSRIKRGEWKFHDADWKHISEDAKDLIRQLLAIDPVERVTVDEALRSPWITQSDSSLSLNDLGSSVSNLMEKRQQLRSVAKTVVWLGKDGHKLVNNPESIAEGEEGEKMEDHSDKRCSGNQAAAMDVDGK